MLIEKTGVWQRRNKQRHWTVMRWSDEECQQQVPLDWGLFDYWGIGVCFPIRTFCPIAWIPPPPHQQNYTQQWGLCSSQALTRSNMENRLNNGSESKRQGVSDRREHHPMAKAAPSSRCTDPPLSAFQEMHITKECDLKQSIIAALLHICSSKFIVQENLQSEVSGLNAHET